MTLSRRDVADLYGSMNRQRDFMRSHRDPEPSEDKLLERAGRSVLVSGTAAAVGYVAGRHGTASIPGTSIPLGLVAGAVAHAAAIFGHGYVPKVILKRLPDIGDGAFSGWSTLWATGQGALARQKAGEPVGPIAAGLLPGAPAPMLGGGGTNRPLSEQELEQMSHRFRRAA